MLQAKGLTRRVGGGDHALTILDAIDLEVPQGEALAVVGPSGSGKQAQQGRLA